MAVLGRGVEVAYAEFIGVLDDHPTNDITDATGHIATERRTTQSQRRHLELGAADPSLVELHG
jgi:hypothetical protein